MYARSQLNNRDRAGAVVAAIAIHAGLAFMLLNISGAVTIPALQRDLQIFDVRTVPPPPPPVIEKPKPQKEKRAEGAAAPRNKESKASPVVAPKPRVVIPVKNPVIAAPIPSTGPDPSSGASKDPGPGTGSGGSGTGTGSGGSGSGTGGGDSGGSRPSLASQDLRSKDYPRELVRAWPSGARVFVAIRVQLDGRATNCRVDRSSGISAIDAETCRLVETRLRFRPAVNGKGVPYVTWYGYVQAPVNF